MGLFVVMSLLLAIIFNKFKDNLEADLESAQTVRTDYLKRRFYDISEGRDYLNKVEMYKFFIIIHSLVKGDYQDKFSN